MDDAGEYQEMDDPLQGHTSCENGKLLPNDLLCLAGSLHAGDGVNVIAFPPGDALEVSRIDKLSLTPTRGLEGPQDPTSPPRGEWKGIQAAFSPVAPFDLPSSPIQSPLKSGILFQASQQCSPSESAIFF